MNDRNSLLMRADALLALLVMPHLTGKVVGSCTLSGTEIKEIYRFLEDARSFLITSSDYCNMR